jgi:hypothetical protein
VSLFLAALAVFAILTRWLAVKSQRRSHIMVELLAARRYHARLWTIRARLKGLTSQEVSD